MWNSKTASGISVKTLELYAIVFGCRLLSIMRHQGYLPYDKSGNSAMEEKKNYVFHDFSYQILSDFYFTIQVIGSIILSR